MAVATLSISSIWDRATAFLSGHWRPAALISLATISVNDALAAILQPTMQGGATPGAQIAAFIAMIAGALWSITGQLALTALVFEPVRSAADAMRIGVRRVPAMVGATLIIAMAAAVAAAPLVLGVVRGSVDLQAEPPVVPGWMGVYGVLLLLLILATWVRLVLMAPFIVDGAGPIAAIRASFAGTRGRFWKLLVVAILYLIVSGVVTLAVGSVAGLLFRLMLGDGGRYVSAIVAGIATGLVSMVALVFIARLHRALEPVEPFA